MSEAQQAQTVDIRLYGLSTCTWCKKTKEYLDSLKVPYTAIQVDLLSKEENKATVEEIKKWNPRCNFPTLVINNSVCLVGFNQDKILEAIK